jgi:hypothetical protein
MNENRKCVKCNTELELYLTDLPSIKDYWICHKCETVHVALNTRLPKEYFKVYDI